MRNLLSILLRNLIPFASLFLAGCETMRNATLSTIVLPGRAIDDNLFAGFSNTDFALAGQVTDENGQPLDDVKLNITAWTVTHRVEGTPDRWRERTEQRTVSKTFEVNVRDCQSVDLRFTKPDYFDQRAVYAHDLSASPMHIKDAAIDCECNDAR
jgi:hypothetical protein